MGKVEAARLIISGPARICPRWVGTATFFDRMWFLTRLPSPRRRVQGDIANSVPRPRFAPVPVTKRMPNPAPVN